MSYQVLARKWRPQNFQQMAGQEHVLKALTNALDQERLHHAYLFAGTRGVGKTTIARIFAKSLNCEQGISSQPCGECSACLEIAEGRSVDLIEIDAASRTKVDDMRELLDNVQYAPTRSRYKVYLIDEVHMLSNSSFNALLKTLEEPPPHIKFLLATTDPQKLPVTVLSRCLQFNLKNLSPERIVKHLQHIVSAETIAAEEPALWELAKAADGSMRDALSLTDQCIAFGNGEITAKDVLEMLGSIEKHVVVELLQILAGGQTRLLLQKVGDIAEFSPDYAYILQTMAELLHRVAVEQMVPGAIDNSFGDQQQIAALASRMTAEDTQLFYEIALVSRRDLVYAPDPRTGFEMALLRMLAFRPNAQPGQLLVNNGPGSAQDFDPCADAETQSGNSQDAGNSTYHNEVNQKDGEPPFTSAMTSGHAPPKQTSTQPSASVGQQTKDEQAARDEIPESESVHSGETMSVEGRYAEETNSRVGENAITGPDNLVSMSPRPSTIPDSQPANSENQLVEYDNQVSTSDSQAISAGYDFPPTESKDSLRSLSDTDSSTDKVSFSSSGGTATETVAYTEEVESEANLEKSEESDDDQAELLVDESLDIDIEQLGRMHNQTEPLLSAQPWSKVLTQLNLKGMTYSLAQRCVLQNVLGERLEFLIDDDHFDFFNQLQQNRLTAALSEFLGKTVRIVVTAGKAERLSPLQEIEAERAELQAIAEQEIKEDPNVIQLIEHFDASVIEGSVAPVLKGKQ